MPDTQENKNQELDKLLWEILETTYTAEDENKLRELNKLLHPEFAVGAE